MAFPFSLSFTKAREEKTESPTHSQNPQPHFRAASEGDYEQWSWYG